MGKGKFVDLTGQRFGNLTVLEYREKSTWLCRCDCGTEKEVRRDHLIDGKTRSCGCKKAVRNGKSTTAEYMVWKSMKQRCASDNHPAYHNYGGRGIAVCERWQEFEAFYEDMGPRPSPEHSLDRIDNDGPYSPDNCRWATRQEQNRNSRNNRLLTYNGKTQCLTEWAEEIGLTYSALFNRLKTHGNLGQVLRAMSSVADPGDK